MASLHSGSVKGDIELLRVETNWFTLVLLGKPYHPTVEALQLHRDEWQSWVEASLRVVSGSEALTIEKIHVFDPHTGEMVEWADGDAAYPCYYEQQTYQLLVEKKEPVELNFYHVHPRLRQAVKPVSGMVMMGMLNFQNEVGYTELELRRNGVCVLRLELEIFPSKIDYRRDYQMIVRDVNEQVYNLSFEFLRRTYLLMGTRETKRQSLTEFWAILRHVFRQLADAVERIEVAPHYRLVKENRVMDAARVKRAGRDNVTFLAKRPHLLRADAVHGVLELETEGGGRQRYSPVQLLETRRRADYDTQENRFVAWMLRRIAAKLKEMKSQLTKREREQRQQGRGQRGAGRGEEAERTTDPQLLEHIDRMNARVQRLLQLDYLREAGEMKLISVSLVLQMAPGYRDVYRFYLVLMKGLSIQNDLYRLSMKDLALLYEYWCFLKIHELLARKYRLVKQNLIQVSRGGLFVKLEKGRKAKIEYENPRNGEMFTLLYNAVEPDGPTLSQQPDSVLTLGKKDAGRTIEYKYVFDAKYRINPAYPGTAYHRVYQAPGPEEEDINTMHRYRDAIVHSVRHSGQKEYERTMFGAYVLFPYGDEEKFREHRFYKSIELVNIGAFPLLPGTKGLLERFLDEIIADSPEKAFERSTRPKGAQEYYRNKLEGSNVLVGTLSKPEQLAVAIRHRFYHTKLRNIADHAILTQLEYVAIYQSMKMFGEDGEVGVHVYGRIRDWQVAPRRLITEIPSSFGAPDELYVRFNVEEWVRREEPIVPGGHGVRSIICTTKYMFDRAREIAELRLATDEQLREWRELRRQGKVRVELDHEHVDVARRVVGMRVEE